MQYDFTNADGTPSGETVRIKRVSPFLPGHTRSGWMLRKPEIPFESVRMPNGLFEKQSNEHHPDYKAALTQWEIDKEEAVRNAVVRDGVHKDDQARLPERSPEELRQLAATILNVSTVTDSGVNQMMATLDPILFESIVAARWADQDIDEFLVKDANYQNTIVAAYRFARGLAARGR